MTSTIISTVSPPERIIWKNFKIATNLGNRNRLIQAQSNVLATDEKLSYIGGSTEGLKDFLSLFSQRMGNQRALVMKQVIFWSFGNSVQFKDEIQFCARIISSNSIPTAGATIMSRCLEIEQCCFMLWMAYGDNWLQKVSAFNSQSIRLLQNHVLREQSRIRPYLSNCFPDYRSTSVLREQHIHLNQQQANNQYGPNFIVDIARHEQHLSHLDTIINGHRLNNHGNNR